MLTAESRARDFPGLAGMHYLNSAAESIPPLCVQDALQAYWQDKQRGMRGRDGHYAAMAQCREISAQWLGLTPETRLMGLAAKPLFAAINEPMT